VCSSDLHLHAVLIPRERGNVSTVVWVVGWWGAMGVDGFRFV